ncbi:putative FAD binding domain containing protein [Rhypophila sp. PSN 637]
MTCLSFTSFLCSDMLVPELKLSHFSQSIISPLYLPTAATMPDHNSKPAFDVLVVGCGLAGLASALALAQAGHRVTVFERSEKLQELGAGIQLAPNATRLLAKWGVLTEIMKSAERPVSSACRSYKGDLIAPCLPLHDPVLVTTEAPYIVAHRAYLLRALESGIRQDLPGSVEVKLGSDVQSVDFKRTEIQLADGAVYKGDFILAADGGRSKTRAQFLNFVGNAGAPHAFSIGDVVYRLAVPTEAVLAAGPSHPAYDLATTVSVNMWMGPGSQAVLYPMQRGMLNVVLTHHEAEDHKPMVGSQKASIEEFRRKIEGWDHVLQSLTELKGVVCTKWTLFQIVEQERWTLVSDQGRFALIGDAAHAILPCLAQGAAQAFEDAGALGGIFEHPISRDQIPDALKVFEQSRRPRASQVRSRALAQNTMIGLPDGQAQQERDAMLGAGGDYGTWKWLWDYDAAEAGRRAWKTFVASENDEQGLLETGKGSGLSVHVAEVLSDSLTSPV